jgi:large subunit ribosomal protein L21
MSYAIIKTGGKQYSVKEGQTLLVEKLDAEPGATLELPSLFTAGGDTAGGGTVSAEVVEHVKGEKLVVFKFKPKRGYKRKAGHRQKLTRIRVTKI